jgi:ribosomal-protein-alanine N-acetyltransferase
VTTGGVGPSHAEPGPPPRSIPLLDTARLRLRPPTLGDAPDIFAGYAQDPSVTRYLTWRPHNSIEQTRAFLRRCLAGMTDGSVLPWVLTERDDDHAIGMIELRPTGHRAEMGYVLARDRWGRGLMSEAARAVADWGLARPGIFRVWSVTDVDNAASARVLEKAGMQREGLLRRWMMHPGVSPEPRDCWCFGRAR